MSLDRFSPAVRAWFDTSFPEPTAAQTEGWAAIASGEHALVLAPTGSGKTLAAFLWGIDRLANEPVPEAERRTRIVYLSPLRALAVDVERNLRAPLVGIGLAAERLGLTLHTPTVGTRTGDTPADERRRLVRNPPDILITTPESLYLMLTSQARETLAGVDTVIVDEIHALAPTKRGSHMALTLERLEEVTDRSPQRIGLSATQRPLDEIARFLGGRGDDGRPRPVTIVDAGTRKELDIEVVVPVEDMGALGEVIDGPADISVLPGGGGPAAAAPPVRRSIWPSIHPKVLELIEEHRSTLVFVNARRLSERLATRLNELAAGDENRGAEADGRPPEPAHELVKAHHGSLSRERRLLIEDELKRGDLKALVATSSLELGIDMGAVDLVVQVESPGAVSRGLQRIGRAGHQVGEPSRGRIFPKHRGDLVEAATVVRRMHEGLIEHTRYPRNTLDVLAQQIVAMVAMDDWHVDDLARIVRRSATFAELSDEVLFATLDLLAGRYPSDEFAELRPRIVWDRVEGTIRARAGAQRLAVTSGGTIPDRGLFGVFLPEGTRVGELDEEMVYESRVGETFLLGATTWRIEDITHERVVVTPAPGQPGKMPFWHGDRPGRPLELGRAMGELVRHVRGLPAERAMAELRERHGLDELAAQNLVAYLDEQAEATGAVPDDRTVVVERFRDEIGDWRVCVLTPFGAQVHAPWAMALRGRLQERWGVDIDLMWSDDGIAVRLPEAIDELPLEELLVEPEDIGDLVIRELPNTALFASRFRECAARALLLPRRRPDQRTALWQQRQRAADLLRVASAYPEFPILLETTRELLNDVFDLPALREVLSDLRSRKVRAVAVETPRSSPFAQSLLFGWIGQFMYDYDAPLAERRAAALALDRDLLHELLGAEELRDLLDPGALRDVQSDLQRLSEGRRARDADELHDLLRILGPLSTDELAERAEASPSVVDSWIAALVEERRAYVVVVGGDDRVAATDDAARLRDALGIAVPMGLPAAFTDPVPDPLGDLVARYARTHGPFLTAEVADRLGADRARIAQILERMEADGRVVRGEFRPDGTEREWCDPDVLRQLRRRSLAVLRNEIEPVDGSALGRFLPLWQGVGSARQGLDGLVEVVGQLQGAAIPMSVLEADVLPARLRGYRPSDLDALCTAGEVVWVGAGPLGSTDGRVRLIFRDQAGLLVTPPDDEPPSEPVHLALLEHLEQRGASFWPDLQRAVAAAELPYDDETVLAALWDLVWAGLVTNDSLAPLRALGTRAGRKGGGGGSARRRGPRAAARLARLGPPAAAGRWSLVAPLLEPLPTATESAHARAGQLLDRYGVLTREAALGEGAEGGFAGVYPVLKALEERGHVRRGYFVAGLGAAQFALPGAVDRLRAVRERGDDAGEPVVLAATDPAQPYGAALPWPPTDGRPARAAGAFVVLAGGVPAVYVERGGRTVVTFEGHDRVDWPRALAELVDRGRVRAFEIAKADGEPIGGTELAARLEAAGFVPGYRGMIRRAPR
ncbi:Lhr family helicase [Actinomarinicola tropica]|uniref:DEAD/DEAH box helicase n=1 Tax=Actinomarinicola tropica TaxID=2789776 RepID=A0A5Q2RR41_9ACTN|nr:DEAD/DEAH box helicase [Actinomarinicola tropica]QGG96370.1 DEAD/DEAH box helicase [Actinomarinicola tropica]